MSEQFHPIKRLEIELEIMRLVKLLPDKQCSDLVSLLTRILKSLAAAGDRDEAGR